MNIAGSSIPQTCISNIRELSDELESFVRENCMSRHEDGSVISEAYQSIKKLFDRSEEDRIRLQAEKDDLMKAFANVTRSAGCESSNVGYDTDDEGERIRSKISSLKEDVISKQITIEELKYQHQVHVRKLETLNKDEVHGLREALSITSKHLDKWKAVYTEDITRLQEELNRKNTLLEALTAKRSAIGTVGKSCGTRYTHESC